MIRGETILRQTLYSFLSRLGLSSNLNFPKNTSFAAFLSKKQKNPFL